MAEIEIKGKKEKLQRLKKHLEKEHPTTKGRIKIEENERKNKKILNTIITGKF